MIRVLVSSCLLGEPVRYHGGHALTEDLVLRAWDEEGRLVPFCPEVAGGLGVPRPAAEIRGGDGLSVLGQTARVVTREDEDVSDAFLRGARLALEEARRHDVGLAVLTARSPSCGSIEIYDGSFTGRRQAGVGVTTALLESEGIRVFSHEQTDDALAYLRTLEASGPPD